MSCSQLMLPLQRERYIIPVEHPRESAWTVKIKPVQHMPGPRKHRVKAPANVIPDTPEV